MPTLWRQHLRQRLVPLCHTPVTTRTTPSHFSAMTNPTVPFAYTLLTISTQTNPTRLYLYIMVGPPEPSVVGGIFSTPIGGTWPTSMGMYWWPSMALPRIITMLLDRFRFPVAPMDLEGMVRRHPRAILNNAVQIFAIRLVRDRGSATTGAGGLTALMMTSKCLSTW